MKKTFYLIILLSFILSSAVLAGDPDDLKMKYYDLQVISKDRLIKDYPDVKKEYEIKSGKPIDLYLDIQLGAGSTSANISNALTNAEYETNARLGLTLGGLLHVKLFDIISFTSGLSFQGKSFKFSPPEMDTAALSNFGPGEKTLSNTFMNIPLYFNIGGMISEKVGLTFCGGPYLGIRMNDDNYNGMGFKNFDLGLNGTLTANYLIMYPFNVIAGVKFDFGGLNNLGSTEFIDNITTNNFTFFTGGRIWF
ncbi:MAG: hypothetical protein JW917_01785 [Ignavibacteria bacterium]|nr:hypothetical protein [Ignavibacteria bacterium]